jgi:hypothetical protein
MSLTHNLIRDPATLRLDSRNPLGQSDPLPTKVVNVQQTGATSSSVTLSWDPATDATSYNVYVNSTTVKTLTGVTGTSTTVTGLTASTGYAVRVSGSNAIGEGALSDARTMNTSAAGAEGDLSVLKAFPTAEGGGAKATGGRGGQIIEVTTLEDYATSETDPGPPGSLRAALLATGPRIIIFRVGGPIYLRRPLVIRNGDFTVAGQTAPGDGIQLIGKYVPTNVSGSRDMIFLAASNTIWRYIRIHDGLRSEPAPGANNSVSSSGSNNIFDHCTLVWAHDEVISVTGSNVTLQYCIISECLRGHSTGGIWSGDNQTLHHNLWSNMSHRMSTGAKQSRRFINNIVYNWRSQATDFGANVSSVDLNIDYIGNIVQEGPQSRTRSGIRNYSLGIITGDSCVDSSCSSRVRDSTNTRIWTGHDKKAYVYAHDNYNSVYEKNQFDMVRIIQFPNGGVNPIAGDWRYPNSLRRSSPMTEGTNIPVTAHPTGSDGSELHPHVLPKVGVAHKLNHDGYLVPSRDTLDTRYVNEYLAGRQNRLDANGGIRNNGGPWGEHIAATFKVSGRVGDFIPPPPGENGEVILNQTKGNVVGICEAYAGTDIHGRYAEWENRIGIHSLQNLPAAGDVVVGQTSGATGTVVEPEVTVDVGGYPVIQGGTPYPHTGDGISNAWKIRNGFNTTDQIANTLVPSGNGVASGWTYLDLFLAGRDLI